MWYFGRTTDCPSGRPRSSRAAAWASRTVEDPVGLSDAILSSLDAPTEADLLRARATDFGTDAAASRYLSLFEKAL